MIRRRRFNILLTGGMFSVSIAAFAAAPRGEAQRRQRDVRIGYLAAGSDVPGDPRLAGFLDGMRQAGWVEGKNLALVRRFADDRLGQLPALARELAARGVDAIFAPVTPAALAAKAATDTIPIVFAVSADPVGAGLVASLAHPGGNVTGFSSLNVGTAAKRLELLRSAIPGATRFAVLLNPANVPDQLWLRELQGAAASLGVELTAQPAREAADITPAFAALREHAIQGLLVIPSPLNLSAQTQIVERTRAMRLPAIFGEDSGARAGGLMSYGVSWPAQYRRAAGYIDRILRGEKPADLPVQQPTEFELILNLKSAKALGISVPNTLLVAANEVIE